MTERTFEGLTHIFRRARIGQCVGEQVPHRRER